MRREDSPFSRRPLPAVVRGVRESSGTQGAPAQRSLRTICFVSGTRAEFGLMRSALDAIADTPDLQLQLLLTGMHLDRARGRSLDAIRAEGWHIDRVLPWKAGKHSPTDTAQATGRAIAAMAAAYAELKPDIVLVVGDRVEAFAAAAAAHIAGIIVAHVHGGDRALGLVDDSLRHAITKLAHLHFPATRQSAERINRLGEDRWRIIRAGAPGLDGIVESAAPAEQVRAEFPALRLRRFGLLVLHPASADPRAEQRTARIVFEQTRRAFAQVVVVYPNNDPGSTGIASEWDARRRRGDSAIFCRNLPRSMFLALMRESAALVGNSSAGIIEAASFGVPVLDIGPRQTGRECSGNVRHVTISAAEIAAALRAVTDVYGPRWRGRNVYGGGGAGRRIAAALANADLDRLRRKLIAY